MKVCSESKVQWNKKSILILFFLCTLILIFEITVYFARWALLISFVGVGFGVILTPILQSMHSRMKTPRALNAALLTFGFLLLIGSFGFLIVDLLTEQLTTAANSIPQLADKITIRLSEILRQYPWVSSQVDQMGLAATIRDLAQRATHGVWIGGSFFVGVTVACVIGLYVAISPVYYFEGLLSFIPKRHRDFTAKVLCEIAVNLRRWFGAQLLAMTIVGVATTVVLWAIGVDYWLLFGLLAGLLDFVPYLGPILPLTAVLFVNIAIAPWKIPLIIAAFIAIHQFENSVVVPLIFKYRMKFPPALLIAMMLVMGNLFGVIGLLLTPSFFSVFQAIILYFRNEVGRANEIRSDI